MKMLKISEKSHNRLTTRVGELIAAIREMRTYEDAIEALLDSSVLVPPEFGKGIQDFSDNNKQFGFTSTDEFFKEGARQLTDNLTRIHKPS